MNAEDVKVGQIFVAEIRGRLLTVEILGSNGFIGFRARNLDTGRVVNIKNSDWLRWLRKTPGTCLVEEILGKPETWDDWHKNR